MATTTSDWLTIAAMASLSFLLVSFPTKCSAGGQEDEPKSFKAPKQSSVKMNGFSTGGGHDLSARVASPAFHSGGSAVVTKEVNGERSRVNIPNKKQTNDPYRQGMLVDSGHGYRQTVVIRSYEIGLDKTATLETILNFLQETALNHVWMSGLLSDGFGATHGMVRNNLIWVVTRMHVQVDKYPIWGEVMEVETWVGPSGKNGMRRDWLVRSHLTDQVYARATSTWVMMNRETRKLSKVPEEVRDEISPWFSERRAIKEDTIEKIIKLDEDAEYVDTDLKPRLSDLDMNHHVNNVKYVRWMLETIPEQFLENHQLSSIILEYRRECGIMDTVESICEPDEDSIPIPTDKSNHLLTGFKLTPQILDGRGLFGYLDRWPTAYTHLLQIKGGIKNAEIVREGLHGRRSHLIIHITIRRRFCCLVKQEIMETFPTKVTFGEEKIARVENELLDVFIK